MIILNKEKIISLKGHKVGGTSLEIALSKFADDTSIITPIGDDEKIRKKMGWTGPQNYKYSLLEVLNLDKKEIFKALINKKMPNKFWNHISAKAVKESVGHDIWDNYTKISIIRNPFDRMVSSYYWNLKTDLERAKVSFEEFCLSNPHRLLINKPIYEIDGVPIIDFMIRYEYLNEDLKRLEKINPKISELANSFSNINAKSGHRPSRARTEKIFKDAPRARELIRNVFFDDIEKYGFEIPNI